MTQIKEQKPNTKCFNCPNNSNFAW